MRRPRTGRASCVALAILAGATAAAPRAHDAGLTRAEVAAGNGRLRITLGVDARLVPPDTEPRDWAGALVLRFDGRVEPVRVELPDGPRETAEEVDIVFIADVPSGASSFTIAGSALFGPLVIRIAGAGEDARRFVAAPGRASDPVPLDGVLAAGTRGTLAGFVALGFRHIVPDGLDHVLFVFGLCLAGGGWRALLAQVTAFTVAHSATLACAMMGLVSLPDRVVEPLIAVSIAWLAVENLMPAVHPRRRLALVFGFGLLHGLGFAGALAESGLGSGSFLPALLGFNVGVELGQVTVIAAATALAAPFAGRTWFRPWVVRPACIGIALVGGWWAVERTLA